MLGKAVRKKLSCLLLLKSGTKGFTTTLHFSILSFHLLVKHLTYCEAYRFLEPANVFKYSSHNALGDIKRKLLQIQWVTCLLQLEACFLNLYFAPLYAIFAIRSSCLRCSNGYWEYYNWKKRNIFKESSRDIRRITFLWYVNGYLYYSSSCNHCNNMVTIYVFKSLAMWAGCSCNMNQLASKLES